MKRLILPFLLLLSANAWATNYCTNGDMGAAWKFDAASGTEPDCTSNGYNATGTSVTEGVTGQFNLAVSFPNSNSSFEAVSAATNINNLATVSMGAWINPTSFGKSGNKCSGATIISKTDASHGPELCLDSDGSIQFEANWTGGGVVWKTNTTPVTTGSWQHVVVTYSYSSTGNTPIIYYNGSSQAVTLQTSGASGSQGDDSGNGIAIGNETSAGGSGGGFDGSIDEPLYANIVLSSTDVSNIMSYSLDGSFGFPTVTTQIPTSITFTTATGNGNVTAIGDGTVTLEGMVWDTTSVTTSPGNVAPGSSGYGNNASTSGSFSTGAFTQSMTGMTPLTIYYVRAFAKNSIGYSYGNEVAFNTGVSTTQYNTTNYNTTIY